MKILPLFIGIGVFASTALAAGEGISNYQNMPLKRPVYAFVGWPRDGKTPFHFKSGLYLKDSVSYVRIDEGNLFPKKDDSPVRRPDDFDSLKMFSLTAVHSVSMPEGLVYVRDTIWTPALTIGKQWVFKRVSGRISLYTSIPGRSAFRAMDTGTGLVAFSESSVRQKISQNPRSARLLHEEKIGYTAAWIMGAAGVGFVAAGAATSLVDEEGPGGTLMLAGIGIAAFAWIPHIMVQGRYEAAIRAYNEGAGL